MQRFSDKDRVAAIALTVYEGLFCPDCGEPKERAFNPEMDGWYKAQTIECQGCAARHQHAGEQKEPNPAEKVYLLDEWPDGRELPPFTPGG